MLTTSLSHSRWANLKYVASAHPTERTFTGRARRVTLLLEKIKIRPDDVVLDIGCGHGDLSLGLAKDGFSMIGLDVFLPGLMSAAATSSKQRLGAMFVRSSAEHLAVKENIAKIAICYNIWEHVQNRMELLRQVSRVLCQDGLLLLVVPNRFWVIETHYRLPLLSWLPRSLANAYLRVTRRGTEYDVSCPSWWELKESLECGGFGVNNLNLFIIRNFNVLYPEPEYLGATKHRVGCLVSLLLNALPDRIAELISNLLTEAFFVTAEKLPSK